MFDKVYFTEDNMFTDEIKDFLFMLRLDKRIFNI